MAQDRVEAVEKALTLLNCFNEGERILTLADFAKKTGLYKSTILRLLKSLERFGYISRNEQGSYNLGSTLWRLGSMYRKDFDFGETIRPVLRHVRDLTGETASFYVKDGHSRVCLYRVNSTKALRHHLDEGTQLPLDRGAAGKLLLAYTDENYEMGQEIRNQGYTISRGERDPDIAALAVPIMEKNREIRGVLSVSGLISYFDKEFELQFSQVLINEAKKLEIGLLGIK
jgi:DNA-binding IclR family transcriptional regulator